MSASIDLKTMTGMTVDEMYAKLDEQLPAEAYKAIAGTHGKDGSELTDIDPNYATEVLNQVFGPCGLGWGYAYNPEDLNLTVENRPRSSGNGTRRVSLAVLTKLSVWYKLVKPDSEEVLCTIDAGGASDNDDEAYALKGAITYAIGNALSKIGWQKSVYLGKRSHKTVKAGAPQKAGATTAPAAQKPPAAKLAAAKTVPAADGEIEEEPAAEAEAGSMSMDAVLAYVVPTGAWKDKSIQDVINAGEAGQKALDFWSRMNTDGKADKVALRAVALRYVELSKSNHKVKVAEPA